MIVGNIPATYDSNGNVESVGNGSLTILDRFGHVAATLTDPNLIAGPWGVAINDQGNKAQVFVTNVLNGTVTRIDLKVPIKGDKIAVQDMVQVGTGFSQRADPVAFWLGPTGLAFNAKTGVLYVASTEDNAIFAISGAAKTPRPVGYGRGSLQRPGSPARSAEPFAGSQRRFTHDQRRRDQLRSQSSQRVDRVHAARSIRRSALARFCAGRGVRAYTRDRQTEAGARHGE